MNMGLKMLKIEGNRKNKIKQIKKVNMLLACNNWCSTAIDSFMLGYNLAIDQASKKLPKIKKRGK